MVFAYLAIHSPAGGGAVIQRTGDRKARAVLLVGKFSRLELHLLRAAAVRGPQRDLDPAQGEVPVIGPARSLVLHGAVGQRLQFQGAEAVHVLHRESVSVRCAVAAFRQKGTVGQSAESRAAFGFDLTVRDHPAAGLQVSGAGIQPGIELRAQFLRFP